MRGFVFVAGLTLASLSAASAQDSRFGVVGGVALGNPNEAFGGANANAAVSGWGLGVTWQTYPDAGRFTFGITAGFTALNNAKFAPGNPNCPGGGPCVQPTYYQDFKTLGAAATLAWSFMGTAHSVAPYLIAGAGWYGVSSSVSGTTNPPPPAGLIVSAPTMPDVGVVGFSAGIGANFSRYFADVRLSQLRQVPTPFGRRDLFTLPVTVGWRF